jgi:hypothetical protein
MEDIAIHIFMSAGLIAICFYLFMAFIKRSKSYPVPSKIVIFGLVFLAIIGALIQLSQFGGEELTIRHYLKVIYIALGLPGVAVGISLFRVFVLHGPSYFTKN